ncbi:putative DNA binding domain-containing protein [Bacteroidales bacterium OttesenSCG-928-B11]|nr:putative DNA binding domain-containing protein [Bacteroidales bacterium OttesenSCG-928-B11]MDL2326477.1 putative DNA binding domain-containing protein [Bacteroidales bacterium OttesenSCG-928-A14]
MLNTNQSEKEKQNIEYKSVWDEKFLKWICGFANAQGGKIFIGIDNEGNVSGIPNAEKLLEDLPNKVRDILGILVDVNLYETGKGDYIEIVVNSYPYPVNYKGEYHYRSGSTKQEMKGAALDKFLLQKKGKKWDGVPIPNVSVSDLKQESIDFFKKRGIESQRMEEHVLTDSNEHLMENLQLIENGYLKRAAILLFHPNPEKFVSGAYVKIGYFKTDDDLIFQDEVHGNLFEQIRKTTDLLFTKYLKAIISYKGMSRFETFEFAKEALREALFNSLAHKDYSGGVPIQISVYDDKVIFWNEGQLPEDWTIEKLLEKHPSKPYNPDIANAFFRSGYIESWGRGTLKMIKECLDAGLPEPRYDYSMSGFWVEFKKDVYNEEYLKSIGLNDRQVKAVLYVKEHGQISSSEYQKINDVSKATGGRDLSNLVERNILKKEGESIATYYHLNI